MHAVLEIFNRAGHRIDRELCHMALRQSPEAKLMSLWRTTVLYIWKQLKEATKSKTWTLHTHLQPSCSTQGLYSHQQHHQYSTQPKVKHGHNLSVCCLVMALNNGQEKCFCRTLFCHSTIS